MYHAWRQTVYTTLVGKQNGKRSCGRLNVEEKIVIHPWKCTGLFISPSGISDPCGTVAGMVTPKGSMSTEGETLQFSVLPYRCSIC